MNRLCTIFRLFSYPVCGLSCFFVAHLVYSLALIVWDQSKWMQHQQKTNNGCYENNAYNIGTVSNSYTFVLSILQLLNTWTICIVSNTLAICIVNNAYSICIVMTISAFCIVHHAIPFVLSTMYTIFVLLLVSNSHTFVLRMLQLLNKYMYCICIVINKSAICIVNNASVICIVNKNA